jgi:hypothetical protein
MTVCSVINEDGRNEGRLLHLAVLDKKGNPWYSSIASNETDWEEAEPLAVGPAKGVKYWSLCSAGDALGPTTAFLCGFSEREIYVFERETTGTWQSYATQPGPIGGINPETSTFAGFSLDVLYTPHGKSELFIVPGLGTPGTNPCPLDFIQPVLPNNSPAKINATPSALTLTPINIVVTIFSR